MRCRRCRGRWVGGFCRNNVCQRARSSATSSSRKRVSSTSSVFRSDDTDPILTRVMALLPAGRLHHSGDGRTVGACSIATTRDCFESGSVLLVLELARGFWAPFAAGAGAVDKASFLLADAVMKSSIWFGSRRRSRRITEAPPRPSSRRGRIPCAPGDEPGDSNALGAARCQSFLDNNVAQFLHIRRPYSRGLRDFRT
jgi:hypothetical protein